MKKLSVLLAVASMLFAAQANAQVNKTEAKATKETKVVEAPKEATKTEVKSETKAVEAKKAHHNKHKVKKAKVTEEKMEEKKAE